MKSLFAPLIFLLAGCSTIQPPIKLSQIDSGQQVILAVGQVFEIELESNPTTGYNWVERAAPEQVIERVGKPAFTPDDSPAGAVGVGGKTVFRFRAAKSGWQTLRLEYVRAWEQGASSAKTVTFDVVVK